jgi:hypothetical protein
LAELLVEGEDAAAPVGVRERRRSATSSPDSAIDAAAAVGIKLSKTTGVGVAVAVSASKPRQ